jgi:hypothetical protein
MKRTGWCARVNGLSARADLQERGGAPDMQARRAHRREEERLDREVEAAAAVAAVGGPGA